MPVILNNTGLGHAHSLVAAGHVDTDSAWSFSADDGNLMLGPQGNDWVNYASWFMGENTGEPEQTKARFEYPFGKGTQVYRSALIAIRQRAGQQGIKAIFDAAGQLVDAIDAKKAYKGVTGKRHAYSRLMIKTIDDDARIITGTATTPSTDRMDDVVVPTGAKFKLPIPLLWQHDSMSPIGNVTQAKVTDAGIDVTCQFASVDQPPSLQDFLDSSWAQVKAQLVRGLSIGFAPIKSAQIEGSWGIEFQEWEWLELSCVTIPANADASIATIRSFDERSRAALGQQKGLRVVQLGKPGASGITPRSDLRIIRLGAL